MKKITEILRKKQGTTMVEMMVTLLLISIMMTMAVSSLSSASHIFMPVSYTHLRAHETDSYLVCRLLLEKKKKKRTRMPSSP